MEVTIFCDTEISSSLTGVPAELLDVSIILVFTIVEEKGSAAQCICFVSAMYF